jgi:hypothetical protein
VRFHTFTYCTSSTVCKSITRCSQTCVDKLCQLDAFDAVIDAPENPMKRHPHHYPLGQYNARGHSRTGRAHFPYTVTVIPTIRITVMKERDIVGQKGPFFSSYRQRPKSLLNPAFGGIERDLAGLLTRPTPCFGPGMALWCAPGATVAAKSLFTPLRYGRDAKLSVFPAYRHPHWRESSRRLGTAADDHSHATCSTTPHNRTVDASGSAIDVLAQQSRVGESAALLRATFFTIQV